MVVTEKPAPNYSIRKTTTATKTDTPLFDTPASVSIVPETVLHDQKTGRIKDALENVSSVRPNGSLLSGNGFLIRGFGDRTVFRNSLTGTGRGFRTDFDTYNVERLEVLKGPASVLYGRAEPGGLINVVTKRPEEEPYYSLEQRFGSFNLYRTEGDATGPLLADHSLLYRVVGVYESSESFRDFGSLDRMAINPSLTWRPTRATEWTVEVEHLDIDYIADFGLPVIGRRVADVPRERSFGDPNDPEDDTHKTYVGSEFTHHFFNDTWTVRNRFLAGFFGTDDDFINPTPAFGNALQADGRTLNRNIFAQVSDTWTYTTNLELLGDFDWAFTGHQMLVGFDYLRTDSEYSTFGNFTTPNPALAIDIFNPKPSYGIDRELFNQARAVPTSSTNHSVFRDENYGVYFQDHITLWEKLHILGVGRYDWAETGRGRGSSFAAAEDALPNVLRKDEEFSPRAGVLFQPWQWLGIYGSYTTSFGGNNGVSATGKSFDPQRGEQFEGGVKTEFFEGGLAANLAVFDLTRDNLLTPDLSTPDPQDRVAIGEQTSRGLELDLLGEISEGLSVIGSYTWMSKVEVTKDNSGLKGNRLANVPRHAGSLWLTYD
ncbi:MAG: TonB-dependent siderophore receptor, partial [Candidatus Methylomirabilis sp.]